MFICHYRNFPIARKLSTLISFQFFEKKGVPEIYSPEELFKFITGCNYNEKIALVDLQEAFKMKPHLVDKPGMELEDQFDVNWEKAKAGEIPPIKKLIPDVEISLVEPV